MGYTKPSRRSLGHHLSGARHMTTGAMQRDSWVIAARCPHCHLDCWVSLEVMIRLVGRDVKLWNRSTRCRRYSCSGRMFFLCTPPGGMRGAFHALRDGDFKEAPVPLGLGA